MFKFIKQIIFVNRENEKLRIENDILRSMKNLAVTENDQLREEIHVLRQEKRQHDEEVKGLNDQLIQREKDALSAVEMYKREEHENNNLREQLKPKSCDDCIHTANYRKCTSCARYPKIKDKYERGKIYE